MSPSVPLLLLAVRNFLFSGQGISWSVWTGVAFGTRSLVPRVWKGWTDVLWLLVQIPETISKLRPLQDKPATEPLCPDLRTRRWGAALQKGGGHGHTMAECYWPGNQLEQPQYPWQPVGEKILCQSAGYYFGNPLPLCSDAERLLQYINDLYVASLYTVLQPCYHKWLPTSWLWHAPKPKTLKPEITTIYI